MRPLACRFAALAILLALAGLSQAQAGAAPGQREAPVAAFNGLWCGTGLLYEFSLQLTQQQQDVQGTLVRRDRRRELEGQVDGATLHTQATRHGSLVLERAGDELRVTGGDGLLAMARGATFQRASGSACTGGGQHGRAPLHIALFDRATVFQQAPDRGTSTLRVITESTVLMSPALMGGSPSGRRSPPNL